MVGSIQIQIHMLFSKTVKLIKISYNLCENDFSYLFLKKLFIQIKRIKERNKLVPSFRSKKHRRWRSAPSSES